jgi:hypothetical protein
MKVSLGKSETHFPKVDGLFFGTIPPPTRHLITQTQSGACLLRRFKMKFAKIGLAVGMFVATAGLAPLAYADNLNGDLNGTSNCQNSVAQSAQTTDPSCGLNSGHDSSSAGGRTSSPQ